MNETEFENYFKRPAYVFFLLFLTLLLLNSTFTAADEPPDDIGGEGYFLVNCNIDGSLVTFTDINGDESVMGITTNNQLLVAVPVSGTPYKSYQVTKEGYIPYSGSIPGYPAKGETISLTATLMPEPTPTQIGGDKGTFIVHTNVDPAMVFFTDSAGKESFMGTTSYGTLSITVFLTSPPYISYRITKPGYNPAIGPIDSQPPAGGTSDIYANLYPIPPTTTFTIITPTWTKFPTINPTPIPTSTQVGGDKGYFLITSNVDGAQVTFYDNNDVPNEEGTITDGKLTVEVIITGSPFKKYVVSADGYQSYSGMILKYPQKGKTITLTGNLKKIPATTTKTGGDTGYYAIHTNINGAKVYFDDKLMGTTKNYGLVIKVKTTATPYKSYRIVAKGYDDETGEIADFPEKDEVVHLNSILTKSKPDDSESGYYIVQSNVNDAKIYFDDKIMGTTKNYGLVIKVKTTTTPYNSYRVTKTGYEEVTGLINEIPNKDGFVLIPVNLDKLTN